MIVVVIVVFVEVVLVMAVVVDADVENVTVVFDVVVELEPHLVRSSQNGFAHAEYHPPISLFAHNEQTANPHSSVVVVLVVLVVLLVVCVVVVLALHS
mmetsp:Transcript_125886/g.199536  ORF Transcript_125886/g.199536 Transcript_125886/m.199536 type:complete len:98 (-) Transcript_125886:455-748(-)